MTERIFIAADDLEKSIIAVGEIDDITVESAAVRDSLLVKMSELRVACDEAETLTARKYWPFPTYGDLLFGVR